MTHLYNHDHTEESPKGLSSPASKYEDPIQDADWLAEPTTLEDLGLGLAPSFSDDWSNPWAGLDN